VVSGKDPYGRNLGFLDPEALLFLRSSSSIVLMRLSGSRSRILRESGSSWNRTRTSGSIAKNSDH
jgi:hypothetical protein